MTLPIPVDLTIEDSEEHRFIASAELRARIEAVVGPVLPSPLWEHESDIAAGRARRALPEEDEDIRAIFESEIGKTENWA